LKTYGYSQKDIVAMWDGLAVYIVMVLIWVVMLLVGDAGFQCLVHVQAIAQSYSSIRRSRENMFVLILV
jgi:hypothetical protein